MTDTYKLRVAKTGYSITDTNIAHIAFDSDINCFKIKSTDIVDLTVGSSPLLIAHGLSYTPAFLLWYQVNGNGKWFPMYTPENQSGKNVSLDCVADGTDLVVSWGYDSAPTSLKI